MIEWGQKSAGETHSITSHITCNTPLSIWCNETVAIDLQYVGEIKRRLKDQHRRPVDKVNIKSKPTTVSEQLSLNVTIITLTYS